MNELRIWPWLAAFLAGAMLAGAPTYAVLLTKPSATQYDRIQVQVAQLEVGQARLEQRLTNLELRMQELISVIQGRR